MPLNYNPILITTSTSLTSYLGVYVVIASSNITLTLPLITCDGMHLIVVREDTNTSNTVTLTRTSPNLIQTTSTTNVTSFTVSVGIKLELVSYGTKWILSEAVNNTISSTGSYISGTCTANNSNPYLSVDGSSNSSVTKITTPTYTNPSVFTVCVYNISASNALTGILYLSPGTSGGSVMSITVSLVPSGYSIYSTSTIIGTITPNARYNIGWAPSTGGASDKIGIASIRLA